MPMIRGPITPAYPGQIAQAAAQGGGQVPPPNLDLRSKLADQDSTDLSDMQTLRMSVLDAIDLWASVERDPQLLTLAREVGAKVQKAIAKNDAELGKLMGGNPALRRAAGNG